MHLTLTLRAMLALSSAPSHFNTQRYRAQRLRSSLRIRFLTASHLLAASSVDMSGNGGNGEREKKAVKVDPIPSGQRTGDDEEEKKQPPAAAGAPEIGDEKVPEKKKDVVSAAAGMPL